MTVTWNGTTISGPVLIFQDELVRDDRTDVLATPVDGTLICISENQARVGWHYADGSLVYIGSTTYHFIQRRTFILYLIYSQCYFWVHDPLNILPYSTLCYSTVRGRALMAVKFKFAMKNS